VIKKAITAENFHKPAALR